MNLHETVQAIQIGSGMLTLKRMKAFGWTDFFEPKYVLFNNNNNACLPVIIAKLYIPILKTI
jgi:hypothetical protein